MSEADAQGWQGRRRDAIPSMLMLVTTTTCWG